MRSDWTHLWLQAFLALFAAVTPNKPALKVMSAPNILRVGTVENIFVACQDCSDNQECKVNIAVLRHPARDRTLASASVTLKKDKFQDLVQIQIPEEPFERDSKMKHYVYLKAQFCDVELEKVVLLSFQSGYIFIQTDKTIYTPNSKVHYRVFAVRPNMEPVDKNNTTATNDFVITEIVTPNEIIFPLDHTAVKSGIQSGEYELGEIVSTGVWKITARFASNLQERFSAEFEVKEYVLPSFEVKLTSEKQFFHVNSTRLTVNIKAKYLFGQELSGTAYAVFGVVSNGEKTSFPGSLQRVAIDAGNGEVTLRREHIIQTYPNITKLVGSYIYVAVSVLTESGGEMVEAELRSIQIVTSPYTINLKKTPKYFKPGMSLDVVIHVSNPDGTPAKDVPVRIGKESGTTTANGITRISTNTELTNEPLTITVQTDVPDTTQASATMIAFPYTTTSNSYLHISLKSDDVKLGDNLKIDLNLNKPQIAQYDVTYLILSRGQLVKHGRYSPKPLISAMLRIDKDMLPSFRVIAYYHTKQNEVVSDSVWVPVKDSCMGSLKLKPRGRANSYEPGKKFGLEVTGVPEATVGLVAVDKGVYVLNNKYRLTQKKIWDIVDMYDTGCTPGGGKDAMSVFFDAGLLFQSNVALGSPYRQELKCPSPHRRRRRSTILDLKTSLSGQYKDKKQRDCCLSGMKNTPLSYDCQRRSEYIMDGPACVEAFLQCCRELESQQDELKHDSLLLARSEEDNSYLDSQEIVSRTKFPESWLWQTITLPACPGTSPNCATTDYTYPYFPLKDSITTWQFIGISISRTHGICVADPLEVIVRKDFFIDLRLPYSAIRGEQLEIKAILHNYSPDDITVRVDLLENQHMCSAASRRSRYRQEVEVGSETTRSVPFVIIPMKEGQFEVEVKAVVKDSGLYDGIMKKLLVVSEGILTKSLKSVTLNPAKKGVGGKQEVILNSEIPQAHIVPKAPVITYLSVTGREQLGALVENAISGNSLGTLIKQPGGCGEQNMITMTLPVIATIYLDKTNQWENVGLDKRNEALIHIKTGYKNEIVFRKSSGSFAVFETERHGSTWLTAYVVKVFSMAYDLVTIREDHICDAVKYLISTQKSTGTFKEFGRIVHGEMIGDVQGKDSDSSMTAFCLSAMQESRRICNKTVVDLQNSINKAVTYLEEHLHNLTNPYAAAITSYVLANEGKLQRHILSKFISADLTHWPVHNSHLFTLEATAYALLALVKAKAFDDASPVVRWFNQQQKDGGGYGSTQATIMVYQAIAEYWVSAKEEDYNVNVDLVLPERQRPLRYNFRRENHYTTTESQMKSINMDVKVIAEGTGEATVKMVSLYYALPREKESNCQKFKLSVQLIPGKMDGAKKTYLLKIEVLYNDNERDATMTILDIGLLTGFTVNTDDLKSLSTGCDRVISRFEMDKTLSKRGSLIIYLSKVSHNKSEEIAFRIHQTLEVGVLQPAAVTVYEYYDHQQHNEGHCVKFYHPERRDGALLRLCRGSECTCAEENCSMQKKENINNEDRTFKACETNVKSRTDYVYRVRVENLTAELFTDIYTMKVLNVTKEGSYDACQVQIGKDAKIKKNCDVAPEGKLRTFLNYQRCRAHLNLEIGKTYLIMGLASDIRQDSDLSYQYVLGERTWVEYWPTDAECLTEAHKHTCSGMDDLVAQLTLLRCPGK